MVGQGALRAIIVAGLTSLASSSVTYAQGYSHGVLPSDGVVKTAKPNGVTPRMPDGKPDLTGYYTGNPITGSKSDARCFECIETDQAVLGRGSEMNRPIYKPEYWDKVQAADFGPVDGDPEFNCQPLGVPRLGAPQKIMQTAHEVMLWNFFGTTRFVPIDGRKRDPLDAEMETANGFPLGHWEKDVLVIESVGFNDLTWLGWMGYIHSNNMKVTEKLWRNGDLLYYQAIVDDPEYLQEPWVQEIQVRRLSADSLDRPGEFPPCRLQEQDKEHLINKNYRG